MRSSVLSIFAVATVAAAEYAAVPLPPPAYPMDVPPTTPAVSHPVATSSYEAPKETHPPAVPEVHSSSTPAPEAPKETYHPSVPEILSNIPHPEAPKATYTPNVPEILTGIPHPTELPIPTPHLVSTVYETKEYTISSCPPAVTNCPYGHKTNTVLTYTKEGPHDTAPTPHASVPIEHPAVPTEYPAVPAEHPSVPAEHPSVPAEHPSVPAEHPAPYPTKPAGGSLVAPYPTYPATTIETKPYSSGYPTGGAPAPGNTTVPFSSGAVAKSASGLLMAAGLFAALF
ncbi:hypothetical protein BUE80_DR000463 [Diplocarpon rosae]|nr:hypothetical protein BUE80_DR000463 [Diplocarpon rosae]